MTNNESTCKKILSDATVSWFVSRRIYARYCFRHRWNIARCISHERMRVSSARTSL